MKEADMISSNNLEYDVLLKQVGDTLERGRQKLVAAVGSVMVQTYWKIGRQIVEYEQNGKEKAEYGFNILNRLSRDLTERYGKGFSHSNVIYMRRLYLEYPKSQTLSDFLTWSHYVELLKIDDPLERSFYEKEAEKEHWGVRELKRQMKSMLFHRLALSSDKKEVMRLAKEGQIIEKPEELNLKQITDRLNTEFTGGSRKLIFWYDDKGEFAEDIDSIILENAKLYRLEPDNL